MKILCVALMVSVVFAESAAAQSTYVGGALVGEFARFGGIDIDEDDVRAGLSVQPLSRDGESIGFDIRVGRALGSRWGIELAFVRGGTHEQEDEFSLLSGRSTPLIPVLPGVPSLPTVSLPDLAFRQRSEQQHTTIEATAWFRQELGERVGLAFLGGLGFTRTEVEQEVSFGALRLALPIPYVMGIEAVSYGVGPVVGMDAVIAISDRAALTAGVRLLGLTASDFQGWLIRPAVGARWSF